jgi:hypothetical protein
MIFEFKDMLVICLIGIALLLLRLSIMDIEMFIMCCLFSIKYVTCVYFSARLGEENE